MKNQDIFCIASDFRSAIIEAKHDGKFDFRDRMSNFPRGCCDDSCDLLAYYLYNTYKIHTKQGNGKYRDNEPYNTTNHAWLITDDNTIIDITGDQFEYCAGYVEEVYVGKGNSFYIRLEDKRSYENYDITQSKRLWKDYQIILEYMNRN
ncbi:MAG: hypothetical protein HDQ99_01710 [Lachnospiraceae bacterium]|nr:hypothetical protein [Lachnospiraceae bacterium]